MNFRKNVAKDRVPIHKAKGITPSERYLNGLCENSFLSLWSYPGVFRNQKNNNSGDGKELCDMLVVFDNHILIFSDKYCTFPATGNLVLDWQRWYRRAIGKSADQLWGAERWLKSHPDRVYLDRACTQKFPLEIPLPPFARYHLLVVAHGCEERCKDQFRGSGSLVFNSSLGQSGNQELFSTPFMVGDLDSSRTFVHILSKTTLDILLQTLDTISDFTMYLQKKEKFVRSMKAVIVPGEEELLAFYLGKINNEGEHDFIVNECNAFILEEGFWEDYCASPQRQEQLIQDKISYGWDKLIEQFSTHAINATQYFANHLDLSDTEKGLRLMARESRVKRRLIMKGLVDLFTNTPKGMRRTKYLKPSSPNDTYYVFLCLPQFKNQSYEEYREVRGGFLEACVMVVKYTFPEALDIIGIASEPINNDLYSSEDLLYLDARMWSDELDKEAARLQKELGILVSATVTHASEREYPE